MINIGIGEKCANFYLGFGYHPSQVRNKKEEKEKLALCLPR